MVVIILYEYLNYEAIHESLRALFDVTDMTVQELYLAQSSVGSIRST
jgi:hypothetical protein